MNFCDRTLSSFNILRYYPNVLAFDPNLTLENWLTWQFECLSFTCAQIFFFTVQIRNLRFNFYFYFFPFSSILNSFVIVVFLTGMVAMIILRTLHKDIIRYNQVCFPVNKNAHIWLSQYLNACFAQFSRLYFYLEYSTLNITHFNV